MLAQIRRVLTTLGRAVAHSCARSMLHAVLPRKTSAQTFRANTAQGQQVQRGVRVQLRGEATDRGDLLVGASTRLLDLGSCCTHCGRQLRLHLARLALQIQRRLRAL